MTGGILALSSSGAVALGTAGIAAVASILTAWLSHGARTQAAQANVAVNNVGLGEPRLVERVRTIETSLATIEVRQRAHEQATKQNAEVVNDIRDDLSTVLKKLLK